MEEEPAQSVHVAESEGGDAHVNAKRNVAVTLVRKMTSESVRGAIGTTKELISVW